MDRNLGPPTAREYTKVKEEESQFSEEYNGAVDYSVNCHLDLGGRFHHNRFTDMLLGLNFSYCTVMAMARTSQPCGPSVFIPRSFLVLTAFRCHWKTYPILQLPHTMLHLSIHSQLGRRIVEMTALTMASMEDTVTLY